MNPVPLTPQNPTTGNFFQRMHSGKKGKSGGSLERQLNFLGGKNVQPKTATSKV